MSQLGSLWSFLNYSHQSSTHIDDLISKGASIEELLDDEIILSEFKSMNDKLLDYCTHDKVKRLISYIIEEPPANPTRERGYKYPFVSCEILTIDIQSILNCFFVENPNSKKTSEKNDFTPFQEAKIQIKDENTDNNLMNNETNKNEEEDKEGAENNEVNEDNQKGTDSEQYNTPKSSFFENSTEISTQEEDKYELAKYFFSFLSNTNLNVTLVGYFCRVLLNLISKKNTELLDFVYSHPETFESFINHLQYKNLAECLLKILAFESGFNPEPKYIDMRRKIIKKLVEIFENNDDSHSDEKANISFILNEIVNKLGIMNGGTEIMHYLFSEEILDILFKNFFICSSNMSSIAIIINGYLNYFINSNKSKNNSDNNSENDDSSSKSLPTTDKEYNNYCEHLKNCIKNISENIIDQNLSPYAATFGGNIQPFGLTKLKLIEIILNSIRLNNISVNREIALQKIYQKLMQLIVIYEWNNILHSLIEKIFITTLESDSHILKKSLLNNSNLLGFLNNAVQEIDSTIPNSKQRKIRKGYLGYITKMAVTLSKFKDTDIIDYLNQPAWEKFNENYLKKAVENDNFDLSGSKKKEANEEIDSYSSFDKKDNNDNIADKFNSFKFNTETENKENEMEEIEEREDFDEEIQKVEPEEEKGAEEEAKNEDEDAWNSTEANRDENSTISWDKSLWDKTSKDLSAMRISNSDYSEESENDFNNEYMKPEPEKDNDAIKALAAPAKIIPCQYAENNEIENKEYYDNEYWRQQENISIDDVLKDLEQIRIELN